MGSPQIYRELLSQGISCSEKRVVRLMQEMGLEVLPRCGFVHATDSRHSVPVSLNHLNREYGVEQIADLNRAWAVT